MEKKKDEMDDIEFEAFRCLKCGEELMNMAQLKSLAEKYRALRNAKEVKFAKWGNSIAVRIPIKVAKDFKITAGKQGLLTKDKQGIRIMHYFSK